MEKLSSMRLFLEFIHIIFKSYNLINKGYESKSTYKLYFFHAPPPTPCPDSSLKGQQFLD